MNQFNFWHIVVVEWNLVWVVVKCRWPNNKTGLYSYEVYVRSFNAIVNYPEDKITKFIYDKELSDEDLEYYA